MPTLLRIALVLLTSGILYAGIALLAFAEVIGIPDATRLALGSVSVCGLALPPMLAGVFASYWSWDDSARRRLRISLVVLMLVQIAGAAGLIALTVTRSGLVVAAVVLVAIAAALDPAVIALGRAARRIELRREAPTDDLDAFRDRIRAGWRRGGIGAVIGLAIGILISVALLLPLAGRGEVPRALVFIPAGVGLGASIGMITVILGLARRIRDLLGGDYSSARRIGRAVNGKPERLSDDEEVRASRYASIAPAWLGLQTTQSIVNTVAVLAIAASSALGLSEGGVAGGEWVAACIALALVALVGVGVPLRTVQLRRVRAYAEAHPLPA